MSSATIQVRIDSQIKEHADSIFASMGLKTSEAIRMFLQQTINDEALPFRPHTKKFNKTTLQAFKEAQNGDYTDSTLEDFKNSLENTTSNNHENNKTDQ